MAKEIFLNYDVFEVDVGDVIYVAYVIMWLMRETGGCVKASNSERIGGL